jgi:hypothetical protein
MRPQPRVSGTASLGVIDGESGPRATGDSIALRAMTSTQGDTLTIRVSGRNVAKHPAHLEWGACSTRLQLFRSPGFEGAPVFDSAVEKRPRTAGITQVCLTYLMAMNLAPGDSVAPREFVIHPTIPRLTGDSLPAGKYYLRAKVQLIASRGRYHELWFDVPVGDIQIPR